MGFALPRWLLASLLGIGVFLICIWPITSLVTTFVTNPRKRIACIVIGCLLVGGGLLYGLVYDYKNNELPELALVWGPTDDELSLRATGVTILNGHVYSQYTATHKFMAMALQWSGERDLLDSPGLQKSEKFHIRGGPIRIPIPLDKSFFDNIAQGVRPTNYIVLLVPNGLNAKDFGTIRSAVKEGAILLATKTGPP